MGIIYLQQLSRITCNQFAGKTYIQRDGAPIGVRLSCAVARLVMNKWDRKFMVVLDTNGIKTGTAFRYMDDKRVVLRALALGWRWDRGQLRFRPHKTQVSCCLWR